MGENNLIYKLIIMVFNDLQEFEKWHIEKIETNNNDKIIKQIKNGEVKIKEGQIWTYKVGYNIGNEISKEYPFIRPCLVIKTHLPGYMLGILPISSNLEPNISEEFLYKIETPEKYGLGKRGYIYLNQFKTISILRLRKKLNDKKGTSIFNTKEVKKSVSNIFCN